MQAVSEHASVCRGRVKNAFGVMNRELGLAIAAQSPTGYVSRFATDVGVSDRVRLAAERLAWRAEEANLDNGPNPAGIAAACLYEAARKHDESVSQRELGECADVSAMTVRNRWRELLEESAKGE